MGASFLLLKMFFLNKCALWIGAKREAVEHHKFNMIIQKKTPLLQSREKVYLGV